MFLPVQKVQRKQREANLKFERVPFVLLDDRAGSIVCLVCFEFDLKPK